MKNLFRDTSKVELEPKMSFRYNVIFPKKMNISKEYILETNLPIWENGKWKDIEMKIIDNIAISASKTFFDIIEKDISFFKKIAKKFKKRSSIFSFEVELLDPTGVKVESWNICVEKIKSVNFGTLSYHMRQEENLKAINVVFKPLKCTCS